MVSYTEEGTGAEDVICGVRDSRMGIKRQRSLFSSFVLFPPGPLSLGMTTLSIQSVRSTLPPFLTHPKHHQSLEMLTKQLLSSTQHQVSSTSSSLLKEMP